jgi:class 3 adenylate cyclase
MGGVAVVLFSDLVDSTALLARLGDDRMEELRLAHVGDVARAVEESEGRLVKTLGDGAMASFESALGALRAAAAIQASVERLDTAQGEIGLAARVGVAAGEPIAHGDDLHGMPVVIASRLCGSAGSGEVLVQDVVQSLVASRDGIELDPAREYELKGVTAAVRASPLRWRDLVGDRPLGLDGEQPMVPRGDSETARPRLPGPLAAYVGEPLVGRDRESEALREATAPRPGRHAVLVLGEPGIGKTRHAAAVAAEAHGGGALVVLARCPPETVVPFEPWVRAIGELALAGDDGWRSLLAGAAGPELAALVPELSGHAVAAERGMASDVVAAEGARYRLLRGIAAALTCAAGDAPLHVVLDDAHWCDRASAQALRHLLESAPERLVLVVTAREGELDRGHAVSRVLADLRRTGDLTELRLAGLDDAGMAELIGVRLGRAITPRLAAGLRARTAGNPFFAAELARDLSASAALREDERLEEAPVPDAVSGLVEERLTRLHPTTRKLLTAVAAIGPSAPVALAARAAVIEPEEAEEALREALAERLVDEVAAVEPTVAFPHALIREALTAGASGAARARLHLAIARVLEEGPEPEPAELARHYDLAVPIAGAAPAIAAHRAAATAAAAGHDHEQAATHLRRELALMAGEDKGRATLLLELGEQDLLAADLVRARRSFRAAADAAGAIGDAGTFARAALGFAGGDVGFGWETEGDDAAEIFLREGLEALGDSEPRLALRMIFRLSFALFYTKDDDALPDLAARAAVLHERLGEAESAFLAGFVQTVSRLGRGPDPLRVLDRSEEMLDLLPLAEKSGREDLLFRVVQWSAGIYYTQRRIPECEAAIERGAEIAARLGSPRFTWEVDVSRGQRLIERKDREGGEALIRRGGAVVRRLRPDLQMNIEFAVLALNGLMYDAETTVARAAFEAANEVLKGGLNSSIATTAAAFDGDRNAVEERTERLLVEGLEPLRRPDLHLPFAVCYLALGATLVGDRVAAGRLRPLLEPLRPYLIAPVPFVGFGYPPEWHIGRIELLLGRPEAAVGELRRAVAQSDELGLPWSGSWARADLAVALHRQGDSAEARSVLEAADAILEEDGFEWVAGQVAIARAELDGLPRPARPPRDAGRSRPIRALATRTGRRALAALVEGLDDAGVERRFAEPRRQRALLRATARGFQPAQAAGFVGTIAYELEPLAIDPPPDAPWRWAIEVDSPGGKARLREPAPLDAAVTVHFGLADWVRVLAGTKGALATMFEGRCSVEGDTILAARLEAMFGAR